MPRVSRSHMCATTGVRPVEKTRRTVEIRVTLESWQAVVEGRLGALDLDAVSGNEKRVEWRTVRQGRCGRKVNDRRSRRKSRVPRTYSTGETVRSETVRGSRRSRKSRTNLRRRNLTGVP